jgi:hypothetical protein
VFRKLIVPNAKAVVPADFAADTPVVSALVVGNAAASAIFQLGNLRAGNRYSSFSADKFELVYFPPTKELRMWWTMDGY